jgi:hypothetical protein
MSLDKFLQRVADRLGLRQGRPERLLDQGHRLPHRGFAQYGSIGVQLVSVGVA